MTAAPTDSVWYAAALLGINTLAQMLHKMCKEAGTRAVHTTAVAHSSQQQSKRNSSISLYLGAAINITPNEANAAKSIAKEFTVAYI